MALSNEILFRDLNITFSKHPVTKRLSVLTNEEAVKRAVRNIVLTNKYERPFQPLLGADIRAKLFENMDSLTGFEIKRDIEIALKNFEPRVILNDVKVTAKPEQNGIDITIVFTIVNQTEPVTTTIFLERTR